MPKLRITWEREKIEKILNLRGLLPLLEALPGYRRLLDDLKGGAEIGHEEKRVQTLGLLEAARAFFVAALQRDWSGPILVLTSRPERSRSLLEQIIAWSAMPERVQEYPAFETLFYDRTQPDRETIRSRLAILTLLAGPNPAFVSDSLSPEEMGFDTSHFVIVSSGWAIMAKTAPPREFRTGIRELRRAQTIPPQRLTESLLRYGYEPVAVVEEPGTFSMRGGIVDIYSPQNPFPIRVEFFGDEIESLRLFDPTTQRSRNHLDRAILAPASEALLVHGARVATALRRFNIPHARHLVRQRLEHEIELLSQGRPFKGMEYYIPYLYASPATLLDYLPPSSLILTDDFLSLEMAIKAMENQAIGYRQELIEEGDLPEDAPVPYFTWEEIRDKLIKHRVLDLAHDEAETYFPEGTFAMGPRYAGRLRELVEDLLRRKDAKHRVIVVSRQAQRLSGVLRDRNIIATPQEEVSELPPRGSLTLVQGSLPEGFIFTMPKDSASGAFEVCSLLTDAEIFGWGKPRRRHLRKRRAISPESFFAELSEGDYVVHLDHGIGIYRGLVSKRIGGVEREYLDLEYAAGDHLFVPIQHIDRVSRYVGPDAKPPELHRLGTAEWARVRARAKKAVDRLASELLDLYAAREVVRGHAFSPDSEWQIDLEASFPYEETEDQLRAIAEVKADMEKPRPMDRLICGDVGYGKTEVALRAAFKAVMDGKQVAILVPTTVLAQQHYLTFQERLSAFPVQVEMLSRFRSRKEQREILEGLRNGMVDIVIGTHRLLQKDVVFKDLGLLIIDEEQRFGVAHKERLKQLRKEIDVLTLTATPIPRTLHLSLTGIRDMSTIDTPPEERLPIRTFVGEYDEMIVRKAILREMDRGGQVYFVHNRVQDIHLVAQRLAELVPEATFEVAHGKMDERRLSRVMLDFAGGKYDVLVCTTIIESGLDIPNVNTIIIDQADTFGLAQLYQLRGRVGRGANRAYAYLFYDKDKGLSPVAQERLEAILEASELGAGFRIAMRDLEIRGAGEILGAQQHGHIAAVGFDLYCRLLTRAVQELKEASGDQEARRETPAASDWEMGPVIDLPVSAYLPAAYVNDAPLRLRLYRRMAQLRTLEEVESMAAELRDRFGTLPRAAQGLLYMLRLKVLAAKAGILSIEYESGRHILVRFRGEIRSEQMIKLAHFASRLRIGRDRFRLKRDSDWQNLLLEVLKALAV